jgi:D-arabinose 1-dehydrogenase
MWIPHFYERAKVKQVVAAAPLSMALLTSHPPSWHPAPKELLNVVADVREMCEDVWPGGLPNLALGYSMRKAMEGDMPLAVGFGTPREVHEGMRVWTEMSERSDKEERKKFEESVRERIGQSGFLDWSWTEDADTSGKYRSGTLHASFRLVGFLFIISFLLWLFACRVFDLEMA